MRALDLLLVAGFVAGIFAPLLDRWLRPPGARQSVTVEYRVPAPRPTLALDADALARFPAKFDAWYADSFGLRDKLIRWNCIVYWLGLRNSPSIAAVQGREGWVFTTWANAILNYCGLIPMTTEELDLVRSELELHRDILAGRGIRFVHAIVPDKAAVYPEFLPPRLERRGPNRLEQFLEYMAGHSDVEVVDLLPEIVADKAWDAPGDRTFFELGDHWTDRGCLAGYRALLPALGIEPWPREEFTRSPGTGQGDNWAQRMYMSDVVQQSNYVRSPKRSPRTRRTEGDGLRYSRWVHEDSSLPRVVVFHDSFGVLMIPHLAVHFSETLAMWQDFDLSVVEEFAPDVVIQLYVDRNALVNHEPRIDGEAADALLQQRLETSNDDEEAGQVLLERRFETSNDVVLRTAPPLLEAFGDTSVSASEDGAEVHVRGPVDFVYLPDFAFPAGGAILAIDFACEETTPLRLYYRTEDEPEFSRSVFLSARTEPGLSRAFFELNEPGLRDRLLLGFGRPPQTVRILAVEVRATR